MSSNADPRAAARLHGYEFRQYRRGVRNWGLGKIVRGMGVEAFNRFQKLSNRHLPGSLVLHGGQTHPFLDGRGEGGRAQPPSWTCSRAISS